MTIGELLAIIGDRQVSLRVTDGRIHFTSKKRLPSGFVDGLRYYKSALLRVLSGYDDQEVIVAPLSYNQQSLWITHEMDRASSAYNVVLPLHVRSPIGADRIRSFLTCIVGKHEQLQVRFRSISDDTDTVPCQMLCASGNPEFTQVDGSSWSRSRVDTTIDGFAKAPFDLGNKPPFRTLYLENDFETYVVFAFHHIVVDAISLGVFTAEFDHFFRHGALRDNDSLPYTEFIAPQQRDVQDNKDLWLSYFRPRISKASSAGLSSAPPEKRNRRKGESLFFLPLDDELDKLRDRCRQWSITPFSFFFSCFQLLGAYQSKQKSIRTGVLFSGRSATRYMNTMGYFVNPLPVISTLDESDALPEWFAAVHREILSTADVQSCPFSLLIEEFTADACDGTPRFSNLFNMLNERQLGKGLALLYPMSEEGEISVGGLKVKPYPLKQQEGQFELTLELVDRGGDIQGILKYDADLFGKNDAELLVEIYRELVRCCIEETPASIAALFDALDARAAEREGYRRVRLSIAATFTATVTADFLELWKTELGLRCVFDFAPYGQIEQPLIANGSQTDRDHFLFLLIRLEDLWQTEGAECALDLRTIEGRMTEIVSLTKHSAESGQGRIVLIFCPASNAVVKDRDTFERLNQIERDAAESLGQVRRAIVLTSSGLRDAVGTSEPYEPATGIVGHVPYTEPFFGGITRQMIRFVYDCCKTPCKAVMVDCDNTLWEGVAGEGNLQEIVISEHSKSVQSFLKSCARQGIPIGLASKNNREDTMAVFENHPDMVLELNDISFERINWKPKSINISEMLAEANLTQIGVVFIDDNPTECAEVKANCPEVTVVQLPVNLEERAALLRNFWAFDHLNATREDAARVAMYREENARKSLRKQSTTFSDYIAGLEMSVVIRAPESEEIARMSQLSMRTNQFTIGAKRRSESDMLKATQTHDVFVVRVRDRFGDYGLVGVASGTASGECYRVVDLFLSCRALGRGVEHRVLAHVGKHAATLNCKRVDIPFVFSGKNRPMAQFLDDLTGVTGTAPGSKTYTVAVSALKETTFEPNVVAIQSVSMPSSLKGGETHVGLFPDRLLEKAARLSASPAAVINGVSALRKRRNQEVDRGVRETIPIQRPRDRFEAELLAIWRDAIGRDEISVLEDFFDAGGRSVLLPHIAERIQRQLEQTVSLVDLFQYPTIATLAARLRGGAVQMRNDTVQRTAKLQRSAFSEFKKKYADR